MPGAEDTFRALKDAGIKVALNTGFNRVVTQTILDRLGWTGCPLIDAVISSDEVPRGRPHPDMIRPSCERLGLTIPLAWPRWEMPPPTCRRARMLAVACRGSDRRDAHAGAAGAYPHTHLIGSVKELPELLLASLEQGSLKPARLLPRGDLAIAGRTGRVIRVRSGLVRLGRLGSLLLALDLAQVHGREEVGDLGLLCPFGRRLVELGLGENAIPGLVENRIQLRSKPLADGEWFAGPKRRLKVCMKARRLPTLVVSIF